MPIYEYVCRACQHPFELVVLAHTVPACPACQGQDLERQLSAFAVSSQDISRSRVKAARKAALGSKDHKDKSVAEAEHIREHIREGAEH